MNLAEKLYEKEEKENKETETSTCSLLEQILQLTEEINKIKMPKAKPAKKLPYEKEEHFPFVYQIIPLLFRPVRIIQAKNRRSKKLPLAFIKAVEKLRIRDEPQVLDESAKDEKATLMRLTRD